MRVKEYRLLWKMSQKDLAHTTGLSIRQIRDIESGKVSPLHIRADTAIRLAHAFGVAVEDLLGVAHVADDGHLLYLSEFVPFTPTQPEV